MNPSPALWAALGVELPKQTRPFGKVPSLLLSDVLLIVGVGVALLLALAGGIYGWMKWRRNRRRHISGGEKVYRDPHSAAEEEATPGEADANNHSLHHHPHGDGDDEEDDHEQGDHRSRRRYKYRVRRRTHRSRNPTLSETGGLPPVKSPEPGKSS